MDSGLFKWMTSGCKFKSESGSCGSFERIILNNQWCAVGHFETDGLRHATYSPRCTQPPHARALIKSAGSQASRLTAPSGELPFPLFFECFCVFLCFFYICESMTSFVVLQSICFISLILFIVSIFSIF